MDLASVVPVIMIHYIALSALPIPFSLFFFLLLLGGLIWLLFTVRVSAFHLL